MTVPNPDSVLARMQQEVSEAYIAAGLQWSQTMRYCARYILSRSLLLKGLGMTQSGSRLMSQMMLSRLQDAVLLRPCLFPYFFVARSIAPLGVQCHFRRAQAGALALPVNDPSGEIGYAASDKRASSRPRHDPRQNPSTITLLPFRRENRRSIYIRPYTSEPMTTGLLLMQSKMGYSRPLRDCIPRGDLATLRSGV